MCHIEGATEPSYTVAAVTGYSDYQCVVSDPYGNSVTVWTSASVSTNLRAEPADGKYSVKVGYGETAVLSVTATCETDISYQWYQEENIEGENGTWTYHRIRIDGETEPTFRTTVEGIKDYQCEVSDTYGNTQYIWFSVGVENHLTAYSDQTYYRVPLGESVLLSVTATADELPISYQWYKQARIDEGNGNWHTETRALEGETGPAYQIDEVRNNDGYYCRVSDVYGNETTVWFNVGIDSHLTAHAFDYNNTIYVDKGETATLTVDASSDAMPLTYQWYRIEEIDNGTYTYNSRILISGADEPSYTTEAINSRERYACDVTDASTNSVSVWFTVSVDTHLTVRRVGDSSDVYVNMGETTTLAVEASSDATPLSYQWYKSVLVEGSNGSYWESNPIADATEASYTTGAIDARTEYRCEVTDAFGNSTSTWFWVNVDTHLTARPANDRSSFSVNVGETAELAVVASCDDESLTYQWYWMELVDYGTYTSYDRHPISNANGTSYVTEPIHSRCEYMCEVSDSFGNDRTVWFYVSVDTHLDAHAKDYQDSISVALGEQAELVVEATCDAMPLSYQWYEEVRVYYDDGVSYYWEYQPIEGATKATYVAEPQYSKYYYCEVSDLYGSSQRVDIYVNVDSQLEAHAKEGQDYFSVAPNESVTLEVEASCLADVSYQWYEEVRVDQDDGSYYWYNQPIEGATEAAFVTHATGRMDLYCRVSDPYGNWQDVYFYVRVNTNLQAHAKDYQSWINVSLGESAELTVEATCDVEGMSYQWYDAGEYRPIEGETDATYSVTNVTSREDYFCRVSDSYGNERDVYFYVALDTHLQAEAKDDKSSITVAPGESAELVVEATCDAEINYQWYVQEPVYDDNGNVSYWENRLIDGEEDATYSIPVVNERKDYFCEVSDPFGNSQHVHFDVRVETNLQAHAKDDQSWINVSLGETAELVVEATCDAMPLAYQWYDGNAGEPIEGATDATYVTDVNGRKDYYCLVRDPYGNTRDVWFYVSVETHLEAHAKDDQNHVLVAPGETSDLVVVASCDAAISYQWYKRDYTYSDDGSIYGIDNLPIDGAVEASYSVTEVTGATDIDGAVQYFCLISDPYGNSQEVWYFVSVKTE